MNQDIKYVRDAFLLWPPSSWAGSYAPCDTHPLSILDAVIISVIVQDNDLVFRLKIDEKEVTSSLPFKDSSSRELITHLLANAEGKTIRKFGEMEITKA